MIDQPLPEYERTLMSDMPFDTSQNYIAGEWRSAASNETLSLENPSDGTELTRIARGGVGDIDRAVAAARDALAGPWGRMTAAERGRLLASMGRLVLEKADELARLEALDVGKPLRQAKADALALARYLEFYGGAADKLHGETIPYQQGYTVLTLREPHGVTGHIVPWNYPMQIIGRSVGAALAMGNATVLKPAEEACLTALAFARIAEHAGFPAGALNVVTGLGEEAGAALSGHGGIDHISFTGSVATGALVQAAAARNAMPVTLELGGKSPQIVFADADLDAALPFLVNAGIQNAGQTCSAASRILIQRPIHDALLAAWPSATAPSSRGRPSPISMSGRSSPAAAEDRGRLSRVRPQGRPRHRGRGQHHRQCAARAATTSAPTLIAGVTAGSPPGAGRDLRSGAGGHPLRGRGRCDPHRQRHALRPRRRRVDPGRRPPFRLARAIRTRPGLRQQLRGGRRRGAALRRRRSAPVMAAKRASRRSTASRPLKTVAILHG